jgi:hypothetical protein
LCINFDQSGFHLVPTSDRTFAPKGAKDVIIRGKNDKRQVTLLVSASASGVLLPLQLVFAGKTKRCLPKSLKEHLVYTFSDNHWSNAKTMDEYLNTILFPYLVETRSVLGLPENHKALIIMDVWHGHREDLFRAKLTENNCMFVYVPGGLTSILQPMDVGVNGPLKSAAAKEFARLMQQRVANHVTTTGSIDGYEHSLAMEIVRTLAAECLEAAWLHVSSMSDHIRDSFTKATITDGWNATIQDAAESVVLPSDELCRGNARVISQQQQNDAAPSEISLPISENTEEPVEL